MQGERTLFGITVAAKPTRKVVQLDAVPAGGSSHWSKRRRGQMDAVPDSEVSVINERW